jgi:DNA polymerase III alpha subunit (gram-positive type)
MFDTRNLYHQAGHLNNAISTQHYRTVTDTRKSIFGQTIDILQDELVTMLKRLLYMENKPLGEIRDLILVGHGFGFEIKAMKGLGIDLTLAPSVIEIFDTEFLGYEVFGKDFKCSLSKVIKEVGILGESFHNAGNDANFTLRAMLLLAIYRYDPSKLDRAQREKIEMYKKLTKF